MNVKRLARTTLYLIIILATYLYATAYCYAQEPLVIPLSPVEVYIKPPIEGDDLGKEFLLILTAEFKSKRGVFKIVGDDDKKHCVIIFAVSPIHDKIGLRGYSASYNVVTKHSEDLRIDTIAMSALKLSELAEIAVRETMKLFTNKETLQ